MRSCVVDHPLHRARRRRDPAAGASTHWMYLSVALPAHGRRRAQAGISEMSLTYRRSRGPSSVGAVCPIHRVCRALTRLRELPDVFVSWSRDTVLPTPITWPASTPMTATPGQVRRAQIASRRCVVLSRSTPFVPARQQCCPVLAGGMSCRGWRTPCRQESSLVAERTAGACVGCRCATGRPRSWFRRAGATDEKGRHRGLDRRLDRDGARAVHLRSSAGSC